MKKILFLCVANASRSQMAEGLARNILGPDIEVMSAGSQPKQVNPLAVNVMTEIGIDMSYHHAKSVESIDKSSIDLVVTLCAEEVCPIFQGKAKRLHWPILDPDSTAPELAQQEIEDRFRTARDQLKMRIEILKGLMDLPESPVAKEFHGSIRVNNLPASVRFYAWLLNTWPREWTHRYATFIRPDLKLNFVLLVVDDKTLHQDTLYHLGVCVADRQQLIESYHLAKTFDAHIEKPPRTTWKGTPLHELWLKDPDGTLIEIYARLTDEELTQKPENELPEFLIPGTEVVA